MNNWYVELGGSAILYSVNYEKYLYRNQGENITWLGRIGAGFNPIDFPDYHMLLNKVVLNKNSFTFPFTSTILIGSGKEKLEVGGGFTLLTRHFFNRDIAEREVIPNIVLGFRVMESNSVCFRISYIPLIRNGDVIHWMGVSIGKNFNFK